MLTFHKDIVYNFKMVDVFVCMDNNYDYRPSATSGYNLGGGGGGGGVTHHSVCRVHFYGVGSVRVTPSPWGRSLATSGYNHNKS